jgi:hypothetical protein
MAAEHSRGHPMLTRCPHPQLTLLLHHGLECQLREGISGPESPNVLMACLSHPPHTSTGNVPWILTEALLAIHILVSTLTAAH